MQETIWTGLKYIFPNTKSSKDFSSTYAISNKGEVKNVHTCNLIKVTNSGRTRKCKIAYEGEIFHINVDKALLQLQLINKIEYKETKKLKTDYKLSELFPFLEGYSLVERREFADLLVDSFTKAISNLEEQKKRGDTHG